MTGNRQAIRSREQMVHSFVREALEALAAPPVAVSILARAMRRSRIDALPHDGGDLSRFVENELIDEVEKSLGEAAAELIRGRLLPIIRRATDPSETSAVRVKHEGGKPTPEAGIHLPDIAAELAAAESRASADAVDFDSGPTPRLTGSARAAALGEASAKPSARVEQARVISGSERAKAAGRGASERPISIRPRAGNPSTLLAESAPPPEHATGRTVLVAAGSGPRRDALELRLSEVARVIHIEDVMSLFDVLQAGELRHPVVVVDCDKPTVHPVTVATFTPDFPQGTAVLLWGASEQVEQDVLQTAQGQGRYTSIASSAGAGDVVALTLALLA